MTLISRKEDLTGKIYYHLTVLNFSHKTKSARFWLCKCFCGKEIQVTTTNLLCNKVKSCGCMKFKITKHGNSRQHPTITSFNYKIRQYKTHAKRYGREFLLSKEEALILLKSNCHYCGIAPETNYNIYISNAGKYRTQNSSWADLGWIKVNGIDRVNNDIGYIVSNCVSCCAKCNYAKHEMTLNEFNNWLKRLIKFQNDKNSLY